MKRTTITYFLCAFIVLCGYAADSAFADKASVEIVCPESAGMGKEISIRVTVSHEGNNFFHHVEWVYLMINGTEAARWEFFWNKLPEGLPFTREITYKITTPAEIKAEASCNIHGSTGPMVKKVSVTE